MFQLSPKCRQRISQNDVVRQAVPAKTQVWVFLNNVGSWTSRISVMSTKIIVVESKSQPWSHNRCQLSLSAHVTALWIFSTSTTASTCSIHRRPKWPNLPKHQLKHSFLLPSRLLQLTVVWRVWRPTRKLQSIQNAAARLVTGARRCDYITLPVGRQVDYKSACPRHQALRGLSPAT